MWMCGVGSEGWGCHSQALAASQILVFFLCTLAPWDSVGFLCLLNLSLLIPEVLFRDTRKDAWVPASLFFSDPEDELGGPLFLTTGKHGNVSDSGPSSFPLVAAALNVFPCRALTSSRARMLFKDIIGRLWLFRVEERMAAFRPCVGKKGWEKRGWLVSEEGTREGMKKMESCGPRCLVLPRACLLVQENTY